MRSLSRQLIIAALFIFATLAPTRSHAVDTTREFINSCVYGTMAGTLVGLASLAFTSQPGDNLQNIARGASLGLYAGIILGIYAVNTETGPAVPAGQQAPAHTLNGPTPSTEWIAQVERAPHLPSAAAGPQLAPALTPLISRDRGVEGAQLGILVSF